MPHDADRPSVSLAARVVGWALAIVPSMLLLASGAMKLAGPPALKEGFDHLGWPVSAAVPLGITELLSTLLFLVPRTSVLGAVLLTGYMGGAIATHARIGEPFLIQAGIGVALWLSLFLRDPRLRALLPLRRPHSAATP